MGLPIKNRYLLREIGDFYFLLDQAQEGVNFVPPLTIDEIGAYIWKFYIKGMHPDEIAEAISQEYEAPKEEVLGDVLEFFAQLRKHGIEVQEFPEFS